MDLTQLRDEYELARRYTQCLYDDLSDVDIHWRPDKNSSGIGWHLGHQGAVNHYLMRNLLDAEVSLNPDFDALFDSANPETNRGTLPPLAEIVAYRDAIANGTYTRIDAIMSGKRSANQQLAHVLGPILLSVIHHEYQHSQWIGEMRTRLGYSIPDRVVSQRAVQVDGYWVLPLA